jgi:hypothetical protein
MDFRPAGGAARRQAKSRVYSSQLSGLIVVSLIGSVAFGFVAAAVEDVLVSASLLVTYAAATTVMLMLVDFTGVVLAPEDYAVLGARPVSSRTYFAARMATVAFYVGAVSLATAALPAVVYAVKTSPLAFVTTIVGVLLCDLTAAVAVITSYIAVLRFVHPARVKRAMGYVQLAGASTFYLVYFLAATGFRNAFLDSLSFDDATWLWAVPTTWYAAVVAIGAGAATAPAWAAAAAAIALSAACLPLAAGRLSLDYARRVGEMSAEAEPARRSRALRLPGFGRALLVRAQFRFDQRFRMAILGILPLTGFYLLLGLDEGAMNDPFVQQPGGPGIYLAVIFIPMTIYTALTFSEHWRASWIFFATPASHARVVVAAKNFVAIYFLGTYVCLLAALWSWFYERVWHAALHALLLGLLAHLLLQFSVIVKPALPFASEPHKAQSSATMFLVMIAGGIAAIVFALMLPFLYRRTATTVGVVVLMLAITAAIEYALRLRVDEAIGDLEFMS